jgi:hypothetical protein
MRTHTNTTRSIHRSLVAGTLLAIMAFAGLETRAGASPSIAISNQASPSGYPAGSQIFDSAMLGYGVAPTGTITFTLYGPSDTNCVGTPLFTTDTVVNGNGYYQSKVFVTNAAGTYRWTAKYNGDDDNNATAATACSDPAGAVTVDKRRPNLSGDASEVSSLGLVTNTAKLWSASGPNGPTGTLTFKLYGAGNMQCAGAPVFTSTLPVNGMKSYLSGSFRPQIVGSYQWTVSYSGDANNWWAGTTCSETANNVNVSSIGGGSDDPPPATSTSVSAGPTMVKPAEFLTVTWSNIPNPTSTDWVALYAVGAPESAIVAWKYTNGPASGSVNMKVPWGTAPGNYEVRLSANNSYQRLATSQGITIIPA